MLENVPRNFRSLCLFVLLTAMCGVIGSFGDSSSAPPATGAVPAAIQAIFDKAMYGKGIWGLRVVDVDSGKVLIDLKPDYPFLIGSVRKVFSVGELLNEVGPNHTYDTPVYRQGTIDTSGVLNGDLILVASGDLTMGGRTNPDGSIAVSDYDHNEADSLGNAVLTKPDPLAGYAALAQKVAASGIKEITGNIVIDDRLFQPFNFRKEFDLRPIFVNDDVVDLTIDPTTAGKPASVSWRPISAALGVDNKLVTSAPGSKHTLDLNPEFPDCIGKPGCSAQITGELPLDFVPAFTNKFPLVQTFRIVQPSNYARTVFIAALQAAGVKVDAAPVALNPVKLLPPKNSYSASNKVAQLTGLPYTDDAKLIMKVSYNIGADTTLLLFGVTQGVDNMSAALSVEKKVLPSRYGVPADEFSFVDGSGGGFSTATNPAVIKMLIDMTKSSAAYPAFFNSLPILAVDGSLAFVKDFQSDSTLAGATGQVHAKTGTFVQGSASGLVLKGQALGGYVNTRSGRHLAFEMAINNIPVTGLAELMQVFQDQGKISAILWRDY